MQFVGIVYEPVALFATTVPTFCTFQFTLLFFTYAVVAILVELSPADCVVPVTPLAIVPVTLVAFVAEVALVALPAEVAYVALVALVAFVAVLA